MNPEEEFSQKLTETDAYLQLIINQLKDLDEKIEDAAKNEHAVEEIRRLAEIKVETLHLLERVKQSIVLLQIAKNTLNGSLSVQPGLTQQPAGGSSIATTASSSFAEKKKKSAASQPAQKQQQQQLQQPQPQHQQQQESQFYSNKPESQGSSVAKRSTSTVNSTATHGEKQSTASNSISIQLNQINVECNRDTSDTCTASANNRVLSNDREHLSSEKSNSIDIVSNELSSNQVTSNEKLPYSVDDVALGEAVVPETSYSSSDDCDDEYYDVRSDADDDLIVTTETSSNLGHSAMPRRRSLLSTSSHSSINQGKCVAPCTSQVKEQGDTSSICVSDSSNSPSKVSQAYDYDTLYDDDEEELGSIDGHGSVISHLISQVKIGMDLTKVVLPTFILERRSLLEMYADFFAHPDLFVAIADGSSPEDRFIAVVRWYLSAFHAGRKSSVAKKPYNPVLGEVFKCCWDIPGYIHTDNSNKSNNGTSFSTSHSSSSSSTVHSTSISSSYVQSSSNNDCKNTGEYLKSSHNDSPVFSPGNLTFIAEQVSHHPPVSAFYAEHPAKRIQCTGHIYTKSAFLGLSIGVHNIGKGSIYLLDYGEEYTVTFPSAYGRSILSVPWIELGGSVNISCQQTNYSANVTFQTKPFYGGKKHKILCEVASPTKKNLLTIAGEWNGTMKAKWSSNGHEEVFVDTKTIPIIKKKVAPIATQQEYESRRLWKDLTLALKIGDTDLATSTKSKIEQKQRDSVKERQLTGIAWKTREFHQVNSNWFYNNPLAK